MVLSPQDIGIILTYQCNSACKHCLYNCGPRWEREPMSKESLSAALDAVASWPQLPQVHLTGGEPFIHFDLLLHGVREAVSRGIACYVETSASWCVDDKETIERFRVLRQAGLQAVLISCSPFHAEAIPPVRTLRAIRAVMEVFEGRGLIVYQAEYLNLIQRHDVDRPMPLSHYEQEFGREEAGRGMELFRAAARDMHWGTWCPVIRQTPSRAQRVRTRFSTRIILTSIFTATTSPVFAAACLLAAGAIFRKSFPTFDPAAIHL